MLTIGLALASAFCNALNVVLQHAASTAGAAQGNFRHVALYLIRNPLWLLGLAAMVAAFGFQSGALYSGELSVVQPLLVTELVFSLILRRVCFHDAVSAVAWTSASITCVGLATFVAVSEPQGGHSSATPGAWFSALTTMTGLAVALFLVGMGGSPFRRAAAYASSAGLVWAMMATFIKSAADDLASGPVAGLFTHWPIYAVVASGVAGSLLNQAALHSGPLSIAQQLMVIVDPLASIVLGVWLFGEHFTNSPARIAAAVAGLALMISGVLLLTTTRGSATSAPAPRRRGRDETP